MPRFRNTVPLNAPDVLTLDQHPRLRLNGGVCIPSPYSDASDKGPFEDACAPEYRTQQPTPNHTPTPSPPSQSFPLPPSAHRTKRKHSARVHGAHHIPRPRNAFILFRSHALVEGLVDTAQQNEASREIAQLWRGAKPETRAHFEGLAVEEKRRHAEAYPDYKYAPKKVGGTIMPRKRQTSPRKETRKSQVPQGNVGMHPYSSPMKTKRTIPTPRSTPEPTPRLTDAASDYMLLGDSDNDALDDDPLYSVLSDILGSMPEPPSQDPGSFEMHIPEFSYPEDELLVLDTGRVPCLASSAFYNPSFVQGVRVRRVSAQSGPTRTAENECNPFERFLRPTAPIWTAGADWNYWDDPVTASRTLDKSACSCLPSTPDMTAEKLSLNIFLDDY